MFENTKCRICGCTENNACITDRGPCWWVEDDLCSACEEKKNEIQEGDKIVIRMDNEADIYAKCTEVTHGDIVHFMRYQKDGSPVAGFVKSQWVEKVGEEEE